MAGSWLLLRSIVAVEDFLHDATLEATKARKAKGCCEREGGKQAKIKQRLGPKDPESSKPSEYDGEKDSYAVLRNVSGLGVSFRLRHVRAQDAQQLFRRRNVRVIANNTDTDGMPLRY
jgi:hypothetical protein